MLALPYLRRSKKSDPNTVSLDEQKERIKEYADKHSFTLLDPVIHDGVSGTKRNRFDAMEKAIAAHRPDAVFVYHLDRYGRDAVGVLDNLRRLTERGIILHEVAGVGPVLQDKATDFLTTGVRAITDQFYAKVVSEKTRGALAHLKNHGRRYTNLIPFGFTCVDGNLIEEPEEQRALVLIGECARLGLGVRKSFKHVRNAQYTGRLSRRTVEKYLHKLGVNNESKCG